MQIHKSMLVAIIGLVLCKQTDASYMGYCGPRIKNIEHNEITNTTINLQNITNYEIYGSLKVDIKRILDDFGRQTALEYLQTLSVYDLEHKFYKAILRDDCDLIKLFIEAGIDVNKEIDGRSPLAIAIKKNKPNACKALLDAHAEFNKRTVLYYPLDNGFMQIVAHLRRRGAVSYLNHEVFVKVLREEEYKRTGKFNGRLH